MRDVSLKIESKVERKKEKARFDWSATMRRSQGRDVSIIWTSLNENRGFVVGRGPERATTQRFRVDLHRCNSIYQHMHRVQGYILLVGKFFREFRENKFANWGIFEFVPRINQLINVTLKILSRKLLFESRFLGFYTSFPNMISE